MGGGRARQPELVSQHQPGAGQLRAPGQPQPQALGTSLRTGTDEDGPGNGLTGGPSLVGSVTQQGRAVGSWRSALLRQRLGTPGADMRSWAMDRYGELQTLSRDSQGSCYPQGPGHSSFIYS